MITYMSIQEECERRSSCSEYCPDPDGAICLSRFDSAFCINGTAISQNDCLGIWRSDVLNSDHPDGVCVISNTNEQQCVARGFSYHTCDELTIDECQSCSVGGECSVDQELLQCYVKPDWKRCESKSECVDEVSGAPYNKMKGMISTFFHHTGRSLRWWTVLYNIQQQHYEHLTSRVWFLSLWHWSSNIANSHLLSGCPWSIPRYIYYALIRRSCWHCLLQRDAISPTTIRMSLRAIAR